MSQADAKAVAEANEEFYAAFEVDMDRMEACWRHDDEVRRIHPGWDVMRRSRPQVSRSWCRPANSAYIQFFLTIAVQVHVAADTAWVTCAENILAALPRHGGRQGAGDQRLPPRRRPLAGWSCTTGRRCQPMSTAGVTLFRRPRGCQSGDRILLNGQ